LLRVVELAVAVIALPVVEAVVVEFYTLPYSQSQQGHRMLIRLVREEQEMVAMEPILFLTLPQIQEPLLL